ncbi:chemosensory receptor c [Plakobranchus ocellatus]|uniref:Chemosensory receptor c n=1 Tax=Plakobranchus ocellatus TaxID=259542 RepID=A0AAV4DBX6_9GAST|nr:chemosensory receptor c [Plakobranchus ocellatus]
MSSGLYLSCNETDIVSESLRDAFIYINYIVLCNAIACFGLLANALNIHVYWKIGFSDSITVLLLSLSISDLCMLLMTVMVANFHIPRLVVLSHYTTFLRAVAYYFCGLLRLSISRISLWITAFISFEKCMCILIPFKAKLVFTPKKSVAAVIFISVLTLITTAPSFVPFQIKTFVDTTTNATFSNLVFEETFSSMQRFVVIWMACCQVFCLATIIISNVMLLCCLKKRNRLWVSRFAGYNSDNQHVENNGRARNVAPGNIHQLSVLHGPTGRNPAPTSPPPTDTNSVSALRYARERKIGRMIVILSGIHLTSYIPTVVLACFVEMRPEFKIVDSINIIVYYQMSTRYRETLNSFWAKCRKRSARVAPAAANT